MDRWLPNSPGEVAAAVAAVASLFDLGRVAVRRRSRPAEERTRGLILGIFSGVVTVCRANARLEVCHQDKADLAESNRLLRRQLADVQADFGAALRAGSTSASPDGRTPSPGTPSGPTLPRPRRPSARPARSGR